MDANAIVREFKLRYLIDDNEQTPVNEELTKWFLFMIFGKGKTIKDLNSVEFNRLKSSVLELMDLVYMWQQDIKG
ncbi:MAG: hypothetical protein AAGC65_07710 [Mucilaginibacter sp.]|uniref:hypothetical protein n=1 Tax=Mucilaginibacter sp. TaxID=1882438 RepID=UPI0031ABB93B